MPRKATIMGDNGAAQEVSVIETKAQPTQAPRAKKPRATQSVASDVKAPGGFEPAFVPGGYPPAMEFAIPKPQIAPFWTDSRLMERLFKRTALVAVVAMSWLAGHTWIAAFVTGVVLHAEYPFCPDFSGVVKLAKDLRTWLTSFVN